MPAIELILMTSPKPNISPADQSWVLLPVRLSFDHTQFHLVFPFILFGTFESILFHFFAPYISITKLNIVHCH